jgi:large subunit ribosomal protein L31
MQANLHPNYQVTKVRCISCGNEFETRSTVAEITVEVCSNCHPFYTGKRTLVDTTGRVQRFQDKLKKQAEYAASQKKAEEKKAKAAKKEEKTSEKEVK